MKLTVTSKLNIALHIIPAILFAYFAFASGNSFFGGVMAACSLAVFIDMIACIEARFRKSRIAHKI